MDGGHLKNKSQLVFESNKQIRMSDIYTQLWLQEPTESGYKLFWHMYQKFSQLLFQRQQHTEWEEAGCIPTSIA